MVFHSDFLKCGFDEILKDYLELFESLNKVRALYKNEFDKP